MKRMHFQINQEDWDYLEMKKVKEGRTVAHYVREAVSEYIRRERGGLLAANHVTGTELELILSTIRERMATIRSQVKSLKEQFAEVQKDAEH